ncbi:MAG TPA: ABC transporter family substrate-binding protein, partial [Actinomycetes bacterium]|nr:ABC transporter family substrate-binding protein [Actinomycetes bacterium]
ALREAQESLIQTQAKAAGIDIQIKNAPSDVFFDEWLPNGNFDIANFAWVGSPFALSGNQDAYRTGGGGNYGQYASKKVDDLFTQANGETDEAKSAELGNQIDQQLTADMATIPLYAKPTYLAVRNSFANVGDNATQEGPFWNSGLWAQKAA